MTQSRMLQYLPALLPLPTSVCCDCRHLHRVLPCGEVRALPGLASRLPVEFVATRFAARLIKARAANDSSFYGHDVAIAAVAAGVAEYPEEEDSDVEDGLRSEPTESLERVLMDYPIYLRADALAVLRPGEMEVWDMLQRERWPALICSWKTRNMANLKAKLWRPGGRLRARELVAQGVWPADVLTADGLPDHDRLADFMGVTVVQVAALLQ